MCRKLKAMWRFVVLLNVVDPWNTDPNILMDTHIICGYVVFWYSWYWSLKLQSADKHNACPERPLRYTRTCSTLSWRWEVSSGRKRRSPPLICGPSWPGVLRRLCCDCHGWFYTGWVISCNIKQPDCSHFVFGWSCESPMNYVLLDVTSVVFCALLLSSVFCVIEISQNIWIYHAQISNIFCCQRLTTVT
jgi:hypothetical protein